MKRYQYSGFSLIELMVALTIIAILSVVAIPQYNQYVLKSRRGDALAHMTEVARLLEAYYTDNGHYTSTWASITGSSSLSPDQYYSANATTSGAGSSRQTYTITLTARGDQLDDTDCRTFKMTHTGVKTATNSSSGDSTSICW